MIGAAGHRRQGDPADFVKQATFNARSPIP
jgi:hypothetical protein